MRQKETCVRWGFSIVLTFALSACGGSSTKPSQTSGNTTGGNTSTNCSVQVGPLGCPKGLIKASLDGATWNGGVANGGAIYTPVAAVPSLNLPAQDFIVIVA